MINSTDKGDVHILQEKMEGNKAVFVQRFVNVTMTLRLEHDGKQLFGIDHIVRDNGTASDYPITCSKADAGHSKKAASSKK